VKLKRLTKGGLTSSKKEGIQAKRNKKSTARTALEEKTMIILI